MDAAQLIITVLGSAGGSAALVALVNGITKWWTGASLREQEKNTELNRQRVEAILERDQAEIERDAADAKRRCAQEYVSLLKRQLIEAGITPTDHAANRQPLEDSRTKTTKEIKTEKRTAYGNASKNYRHNS